MIEPHLDHPAMAELPVRYPTPEALRKPGQPGWAPAGQIRAEGRQTLGGRGFHRLGERALVVSDMGAPGIVLPQLAAELVQSRTSRIQLLARAEELSRKPPTRFTSS
ncbi:hypothetical protein E4J89_15900 [Arthrobacter sp. CAU 1506]|uniref:hypothetical protein n=1 Tax=Arthrobacter sp. CAU 1506 TaxID=2560052 RepID=UPI0010ABAC82|nr:hypothetical protein [Arthrobacter sp. CAU 1506]TJY67196.1 hypothetical protein E4J89_15900 [Arthrobacter sp. CAU 1506]